MAVDRVERRLRLVTAALDAVDIPYAVIGGNAVASWVGRVDPSATRATRGVDLLVQKGDSARLTEAMKALGFERHDLRRLIGAATEPPEAATIHDKTSAAKEF